MAIAQLRILIAIDQNLFSQGLRSIFNDSNGAHVCKIISSSQHLLQEMHIDKPDVALVDLNSPRVNCAEAIKLIRSSFPRAQLIMLSLYVEASLGKHVKEEGL